jgi:long-chain acyl-CoA synthetase
MAYDSIPARLFEQARVRPNAPAYHAKVDGAYVSTSWQGYADEVRAAGKALMALGVAHGDAVAILGFNRPEWVVMDVAAMAIGAAPAGIYTTNSPQEVAYVVNHAKCRVLLIEHAEQWAKVEGQYDELACETVVAMKNPGVTHENLLSWEDFLAKGAGVSDEDFDARLDALDAQDLAQLIYTSGTTGPPKGVMLSHENLSWTAMGVRDLFALSPLARTLSYLPLSHIAEQMFSIHAPITLGFQVFFAEGLEQLKANLIEARPVIFFGVPRIWEKFYAALSGKMAGATGVKAKLLAWARGVGVKWSHHKMHGTTPGGVLKLQYALAHKLIFSKVKAAIGFDEAQYFVSGAAPVSADILRFFASLDMLVYEVYGQSEDCGPTTVNRPGATRLGTVGPAWPGVDVKIAEDGEILAKGKNVFQGYLHDEEATNATLIDGWLHSGDLGAFDDEGFLTITGRKKDIIITAGGKNIAPKNLESDMKDLPLVAEAVCIGDRRPFLSALICLDDDAAAALCASKGIDPAGATTSDEVRAAIQVGIDAMNAKYAQVEHIRKFTILPRMLTMEDEELTPTLKVKRANVSRNWADTIEEIYAG